MKIDRLIGILSVLLQREQVTAFELAEKFEVSHRTILRDMDALCCAGIPIVTEKGRNGGIRIMEGYKLDKTVLLQSEMQAILAGLQSLDSISGTHRYRQLMEKLSVSTAKTIPAEHPVLIDLSAWDSGAVSQKSGNAWRGAFCLVNDFMPPLEFPVHFSFFRVFCATSQGKD